MCGLYNGFMVVYMKIHVKRSLSSSGILFASDTHAHLSGFANITFNILLRRLTVINEETSTEFLLRQENIWRKILSIRPLGMFYPTPPFHLYKNTEYLGRTKVTRYYTQMYLYSDNEIYEFFFHGDNYISILRNREQVALLQRDPHIHNEQGIYRGEYFPAGISPEYVMLFIEYTDVIWFPSKGFYRQRYDKFDFSRKEPFMDRLNWHIPE